MIELNGGSIYAFLGLLYLVIPVCKRTSIYVILKTRYAKLYNWYYTLNMKYYVHFCISTVYITPFHFRI
jgi:hypothetical protein